MHGSELSIPVYRTGSDSLVLINACDVSVCQQTLFCLDCLLGPRVEDEPPASCFCCGEGFCVSHVRPDQRIKQRITDLPCRCPCGLELSLGYLDAHRNDGCRAAREPCMLGCGWQGPFNEQRGHVLSCSLLARRCERCGRMVTTQQMGPHLAAGDCKPPPGGIVPMTKVS